MNAQERYEYWLNSPDVDEGTKAELQAIAGDPVEIEDRFYQELSFGTAGLRGVLGAGDNRMNVYNVRKATEGLARHLKARFPEGATVAIAYDSRNFSDVFARETACVLAGHGIHVYLYSTLHSVPQLSFTVLHLHCSAGVVITASHNPPKYNGYKVYWTTGGQVDPVEADAITERIRQVEGFATGYMADELDESLFEGLLIGHVAGGKALHLPDALGDGVGLHRVHLAAGGPVDLVAVVLGGVVAGGDDHAGAAVEMEYREGQLGHGVQGAVEVHMDTMARQHTGGLLCKHVGEVPGVVGDGHGGPLREPGLQVPRQALRGLAHVVHVHPVIPGSQHAPKARRAEGQLLIEPILDLHGVIRDGAELRLGSLVHVGTVQPILIPFLCVHRSSFMISCIVSSRMLSKVLPATVRRFDSSSCRFW